ncbi:hypothetical protein EKO04_004797 [Ascochyta lentis]|uniref:Heterokaryon incompatibility domain-containing protein n=1 Tax=Ascochyta lentis TaxID=205686 RepID=A0A8H7J7S7_9PLEO|nr:hypothetical protein EKO04_004797 [Ascochyta lentis]
MLRDSAIGGCGLCLNVWEEMVVKGTIGKDETQWPTFTGIDAEITASYPTGSTTSDWSLCFMVLRAQLVTAVVGTHRFLAVDAERVSEAGDHKHATAFEEPTTRDLTMAKRWFNACLVGHTVCRQNVKRDFVHPSRLIKVEDDNGNIKARLLEGNEITGDPEYATLSHCWGSGPLHTLTKRCIQEYRENIPVSELAKTFTDAFQATLDLQISYIWIDSLCIIQDSTDDWNKECHKMADVYENATLNIAATAFTSSNSGLFVPKSSWRPQLLEVTVAIKSSTHSLNGVYKLIHNEAWAIRVDEAPLNRRGWVLQERFFSSRILHFGKDQLLWECQELQAAETMPSTLHLPIRTQRLDGNRSYRDLVAYAARSSQTCSLARYNWNFHNCSGIQAALHQSWNSMVEAYTRSNLTYSSDKLVAIAGVMSRYERLSKDECLFGLWRHNLAKNLLWYRSSSSGGGTRPATLSRIPSWSWACLDCPITFHGQGKTMLSGGYPMCDYDRDTASVRVDALLLKMSLQEDNVSRQDESYVFIKGIYKSLSIAIQLDAEASDVPTLTRVSDERFYDNSRYKQAYLLCLNTERPTSGLMLKREPARGCYSRIGFFSTRQDLTSLYSELPLDDYEKVGHRGHYTVTLV